MNLRRQHLIALAALYASAAQAQTTNFTVRKPPRTYDAVVRLYDVAPAAPVAEQKDSEHFFAPVFGENQTAASAETRTANSSSGRAVKRRPQQDSTDKAPATLAELAAGRDDARGRQIQADGVTAEILKQQAVTRKFEAQRASIASEDEANPAPARTEQRGGLAMSLAGGQDEAAAMLIKQQQQQQQDGGGLKPLTFDRKPSDTAGTGDLQAGLLPRRDSQRLSDPRTAADGGYFSRQDGFGSTPRSGSIYDPAPQQQPVGSSFQRAGGDLRSPAQPFGGPGAGDLKKPSVLPW